MNAGLSLTFFNSASPQTVKHQWDQISSSFLKALPINSYYINTKSKLLYVTWKKPRRESSPRVLVTLDRFTLWFSPTLLISWFPPVGRCFTPMKTVHWTHLLGSGTSRCEKARYFCNRLVEDQTRAKSKVNISHKNTF